MCSQTRTSIVFVFLCLRSLFHVVPGLMLHLLLPTTNHLTFQTTTNYYIVNLAVADCLIALTCSWTHLVDDMTPFWILGSFFCPFNSFSQGECKTPYFDVVDVYFSLIFFVCPAEDIGCIL